MKIFRWLLIILLLAVPVLFIIFGLPLMKKKKAALQVMSDVKTTVFLNDSHLGQTPFFDEKLKPGEYTLKLVPETDGTKLLPWQGIVKLSPGIMTVVNRSLADREDKVSGYILTLEPITEKDKAKIAIISTPDSVVVNLDGEPKGFTPLALENVAEGERLLVISAPGFQDINIKAKAVKGYKLIVNVQLAKKEEEQIEPAVSTEEEKEATKSATKPSASAKPSAKPSALPEKAQEASPGAEMAKPYVKIKDTPTGWLKVRSEPSTSGGDDTVLTKLEPGEVYKFIEANDTGWYKIEYEAGKQGWISAKYATLYR